MNILEHTVTMITGIPYFAYNKWWVPVVADCWGIPTETTLMFDTQEEAANVKIGYEFLA